MTYTGIVSLRKSNIIGATISPCMAPKIRGEIEKHPHSRERFGDIHQFFHAIFRQNTLRPQTANGSELSGGGEFTY